MNYNKIDNTNEFKKKETPSSIINEDNINLYKNYVFLKKQNIIYENNIKKLKDKLKNQIQKNQSNIYLQNKIGQEINYKIQAIDTLKKG